VKSEFTPGPWVAEGHAVKSSDGYVVAECILPNSHAAADLANAQLIALAPDMLDQLVSAELILRAEFSTPSTREGRIALALMNNIRTLIARATGGQK
jgi:hypothetical protein